MIIAEGKWFNFHSIETSDGLREVLSRRNGEFYGCKVFPLFLSEKSLRSFNFSIKGKCSLKKFARAINQPKVLSKLSVPLIAINRVVAEIVRNGSAEKFFLECPGGVVSHGEKSSKAGIRELSEELKIEPKQVIAYATLLSCAPFDSSAHAEFMRIVVALCVGDFQPTDEEGIVPEFCENIPYLKLEKFLKIKKRENIVVEGYVPAAHSLLKVALYECGRS